MQYLYAQDFQMNENCIEAYKYFIAMKPEKGRETVLKEIYAHPNNRMIALLGNYEDFITLVFNENPELYTKRKENFSKRLELLSSSDKSSPYYLYSKAAIYFQWSMIQIKYAEYWNAAWDFRKSFLLFKENKKKYPTFPYNDYYLGMQEAVISTIPAGYKWISNIMGMKGNMNNGMALLEKFVINKHPYFREEAVFFLLYLKNYLQNDYVYVEKFLKNNTLDIQNNMLYNFMICNLALNNKNAMLAEQTIKSLNKSDDFMPFPMLYYELGDAKMKQLDMSAIQEFSKYIQTSKSNFYIKDAYYNIALCYYLQNNLSKANEYKQLTLVKGKKESDADKQAEKNAKKNFPNKEILKARLLHDGGDNAKALDILLNMQNTSNENILEYNYRLARVYDELLQYEKALYYYKLTIDNGKNSTEYFAARAALQSGIIYEKKGQIATAKSYYEMVLDMGTHEFKNSIDQRAKAALNRLNK